MRVSGKKKVKIAGRKRVPAAKTMSTMGKPRAPPAGGLDLDARRYLALLADPCNAALVAPTYAGEGSGLFVRTKTMFSLGSAAVDGTVQFCPGMITMNTNSQSPLNGLSPILFASVNTTNTTPTNIYGVPIATSFFGNPYVSGVAGAARCLAGCVKVHYTGAELDRSGLVYAGLNSANCFSGASTLTVATAATLGQTHPQIDRLGTRVHEYKWLPNIADEQFSQMVKSEFPGSSSAISLDGNSLIVSVVNVPPGSVMFEVVACWEYNYSSTNPTGLTTSLNVSSSSNSLNDVLRQIGDAGRFALSPEGSKQIMGVIGGVGKAVRNVSAIAAQFAAVL